MRERVDRAERVYAGSWTDAALLNNLLVREGIQTVVAARFVRREPLVDPKSYRSWRCRHCNELIEGQFEMCWNCQAART